MQSEQLTLASRCVGSGPEKNLASRHDSEIVISNAAKLGVIDIGRYPERH